MGCCASSRGRPLLARAPQEIAISYQETLLGLPKLAVATVVESVYRNGADNILTRNQLNTVAYELSLDISDLETVDSKQFQMLKFFQAKKSCIDAYKFTVLAVLLCRGTVLEKAQILFEKCPWVSQGVLGEEGLRSMIAVMMQIAVEALPKLAESDSPIAEQSLPSDEISAYVNRLKEAAPRVIDRICTEMTLQSKSLSIQDFTTRVVQNKDVEPITDASDIRSLLFLDSVTNAALLPHSSANLS